MIERGGFGVVSWPGREWALGTSVERRVFVGRHLDRTACSDSGHHSPKCCRVPEEDIEEKLTAYRAELLAKVEAAKSAADLALQEERQVSKGDARGQCFPRSSCHLLNAACISSNTCRSKQETHQVAARKLVQMERLRGAFGLRGEHREGEAFDRELQEKRRQERIAEREERERQRR